jgi:hypothetical protein
VSHGREAQLFLHDQTAIAANDPRSASLSVQVGATKGRSS